MKSAVIAVVVSAGAAMAGVDGVDVQNNGLLRFTQNVGSEFGNNSDPDPINANGSEINAVYAGIFGNELRIGLAGNLESNFNNLDLFFDVADGGQNTLLGNNAGIGLDDSLNRLAGLTFDEGFDADYYMQVEVGDSQIFSSTAVLETAGGGAGGFVGAGPGVVMDAAGNNGGTLSYAVNNSNVLGVGGFGSPFDSDPSTVTTGFEIRIDLAELGWDGVSPILLAGFVNGGGGDFLSNQVIGGLPDGTGNLGDPANVDFNGIDGLQFVRVPAPGAAGLLAAAGVFAGRRRR